MTDEWREPDPEARCQKPANPDITVRGSTPSIQQKTEEIMGINLETAFDVNTTKDAAKIAPVGEMYKGLARSILETGGGWNADTTLAVRDLQTSFFRYTQAVWQCGGAGVGGGN